MSFLDVAMLLSGFSFLGYAVSYFRSSRLAQEFVRFGLPKLGGVVAVFQALGAIGLFAGFWYPILISVASAGLALMMLAALIVRIRVKDSLWLSLPAIFFFGLNAAIFVLSVNSPKGG